MRAAIICLGRDWTRVPVSSTIPHPKSSSTEFTRTQNWEFPRSGNLKVSIEIRAEHIFFGQWLLLNYSIHLFGLRVVLRRLKILCRRECQIQVCFFILRGSEHNRTDLDTLVVKLATMLFQPNSTLPPLLSFPGQRRPVQKTKKKDIRVKVMKVSQRKIWLMNRKMLQVPPGKIGV